MVTYCRRKNIQNDTSDLSNISCFKVKSFLEKPDKKNAQKYFDSGNYLWNSGMFVFKASRYLHELKRYSPTIYQACEQYLSNENKQEAMPIS